ncbi:MAG: methionine--tRNA ligase [Minisyncoccota bacterium]
MRVRYLTTTLPYVNADPHIGFALELVQADVLARVWRAAGDEVFFNTGTDEHGQKIHDAAKKVDQELQTHIDHYAAEVQKLRGALNLSTDAFIRTTDTAHIRAAQEMWHRCAANDDIYLKEYEGLYCVGHEAFITEKDLVDGKCPDHNTEPQVLREKNYFFKFKKYEEPLLAYLEKVGSLLPKWRRQEAINFVKGGLEDFSISREKKRLSWGVPVPGDDSQVMYVWFDALTNYISTLGWPDDKEGNFQKFWEEGITLQVAGKDQVRFQSLMWQAMLMSAGIKNTDTVFYHGFINSAGKKMSKSLGNVINPLELVEKYGTDAVRYILLRHVSPTEDSDLTRGAIHDHYTAHLTNGLGNLVARVMKLAEEHLPHPVVLADTGEGIERTFLENIEAFRFNEAMDFVFAKVAAADAFMAEHVPYKKIKGDAEEQEVARNDIETLVRELAQIAAHLVPAMPRTAADIAAAVRANKKPENLFPRL